MTVARWKKIGIVTTVVLTPIEIFFVVYFVSLREFFTYSGKGFAAGIGFTVALLAITSAWMKITAWRARRRGPPGLVEGRMATPEEIAMAQEAWRQIVSQSEARSHVRLVGDDEKPS